MKRTSISVPLLILCSSISCCRALDTFNFSQCAIDVMDTFARDPHAVTLLDKDGQPTQDPAQAWGIPLGLCDTACGPRGDTEVFSWTVFSAAVAQWLLPWLALTAQLPYETRDGGTNMLALALAVGSPMLISYSLAITILTSRWLNRQFARLRNENETRGGHQVAVLSAAVYILKEMQHVPIAIGDSKERFAQLVVNPRNKLWWTTLQDELQRTHRDFTYSLGAQAAWVIVVAIIAMVNFFGIIDNSTVRAIGVAINSLWMWMIPVTLGWVWVGTQNSANTIRDGLMRASSAATIVPPPDPAAKEMLGFQDFTQENIPSAHGYGDIERRSASPEETSSMMAQVQTQPRSSAASSVTAASTHEEPLLVDPTYPIRVHPRLEGSKAEAGPIFNFARFPSHLQKCSLVIDTFHAMATNLHPNRQHAVDGSAWKVGDDWAKNLVGTPAQMSSWLFGTAHTAARPPAIETTAMFVHATAVAAFLQWGTTGAAVLLAYKTPVVGLGCVSGTYLLYGVTASLVWLLAVSSAYLSHRYAADISNHRDPSTMPLNFRVLEVVIPVTRYLAKGPACLNAMWVLTLSVLQFAGRYQNCWCMSIMGKAGWVILWATDQQIAQVAWGSWIGSAALVLATVILVTLFVLNSGGEEIFKRQRQ
ncbi:hypothetical protein B0T19DRAFT_408717 [Cercophora scortea]|uniref:Transmembrane protein n=1 Tax=Cercophora scortea TaxID=314031 RepID=A0AAE0MKQ2_9PEZI|nr:hypothetical protein B0T19DRAFT_408717 [Cercophora scortea]